MTARIFKNVTYSSVVVQWDTIDDAHDTNYTVTWAIANESNVTQGNTEQTSYTITGLTLNTVYNINVTSSNKCGQGEVFTTNVSLSVDTSSISTGISPTITAATATTKHIITTMPTTDPTSVPTGEGSSIARSSFVSVTHPTSTPVVVVAVTATSSSVVFPTPTTYFISSKFVYTYNLANMGSLNGVSLSKPYHMRTTAKSVFLLA